jgi:hypothetical protein
LTPPPAVFSPRFIDWFAATPASRADP